MTRARALLAAAALAAACSSTGYDGGGRSNQLPLPNDGGILPGDAGTDTAAPPPPPQDAGIDAGMDAGIDAGMMATDAGADR